MDESDRCRGNNEDQSAVHHGAELSAAPAAPDANSGTQVIVDNATNHDPGKARCFQDAALPHLDAVYTLARYLLRNPADAEDAVQECYLRALRHFDTMRTPAIKAWLFAILRNVCKAEYARRSVVKLHDINTESAPSELPAPMWTEQQETPEMAMITKLEGETIQGLVTSLPCVFREVIVLREINDLSYREIAEVIGAPVGTVMSRLARARSMLREAWVAAGGQPQ
jgi:RNA polymerase sigma-70 factor (ECF subfamily)